MWLLIREEQGRSRFSLNSRNIVRLQIKRGGVEDCLLWADTVDQKGCIITRGSPAWCEKYFELILKEKENPGIIEVPEREPK